LRYSIHPHFGLSISEFEILCREGGLLEIGLVLCIYYCLIIIRRFAVIILTPEQLFYIHIQIEVWVQGYWSGWKILFIFIIVNYWKYACFSFFADSYSKSDNINWGKNQIKRRNNEGWSNGWNEMKSLQFFIWSFIKK